jgi:hypothetical protein
MKPHNNLLLRALLIIGYLLVWPPAHSAEPKVACTFQTTSFKWTIGSDGRSLSWTDIRDQKNYCPASKWAVAFVRKAGTYYAVTAAEFKGDLLRLQFGESGLHAILLIAVKPYHLLVEVVSLTGEGAEELVFVDLPLTLQGTSEEPLAACALALNLKTKVNELPQPSSRLRAVCFARFGFEGARVALIGCPPDKLREVMQAVVSEAEELPKSPVGGPWALGQPINQGSYLFNFRDLSEDKVEDWIKLAKRLGMTQIDFHGGTSFRFGDCLPNPHTYPRGFDSLKAVIDKLHVAGIAAGLHTYSFLIAKNTPWVTPVPDPRLGKDAVFTLAEPLSPEAGVVPVIESTERMSAITGFFVPKSVTLQIQDELITCTDIAKQEPYAFTGCRRGAYGTRIAPHAKGARVYHLKECYGLFVPDADSTLLSEVAGKIAEAYNRCGFDMIYLDALDGEDILAGPENGWHYGSKFAFEIFKRLEKPALMEMSTFHHHLWYIRSRCCARDYPRRSYKRFIDLHLEENFRYRRMFLPGQFGWWALSSWSGAQGDRTFPDDIEYLMGKCLGTDTGMAMMGIDPGNVDQIPALPGLADIIRRYEELRHSGKVPESIKERLRQSGAEFSLNGDLAQGWQFRPVHYVKHPVEAGEWSRVWRVENAFARQPARLRIEALMSAGPYDAPGNIILADFTKPEEFSMGAAADTLRVELTFSENQIKTEVASGRYAVTHSGSTPRGAWTRAERTFNPPLDLSRYQALGLWVYGDGQQHVLNLQLRSPQHVSAGIGDHYIPIDFSGWRYFELIEPEGERYSDYAWPYGGISPIYRESVAYGQVASLGLWYNNLPPGRQAVCYLSPIKALPLVSNRLVHPSISISGQRIVFPVEVESGCYLELNSAEDCRLYDPQGRMLRSVAPEGEIPWLETGSNEVRFDCGRYVNASPRANVTVISFGEPLR